MAVLVGLAVAGLVLGASFYVGNFEFDGFERERLVPIEIRGDAGLECFKWETRSPLIPVWTDNGIWCRAN